MSKKGLFLAFISLLAYGFYISHEFKIIASGVALFLFGVMSLQNSIKVFVGGRLRDLLDTYTNTKNGGFFFGFLSTALVQSTSIVTVITLSFLTTDLIALSQSISILLGANVGATVGTWLIASLGVKVNISNYAFPLLVLGICFQLRGNRTHRSLGLSLLGVGFLILGISYVKNGFELLNESNNLINYLNNNSGIIIFTLSGLVLTILVQSSHVVFVIIVTALAINQISYLSAIYLCIGSNIGTTATTFLASIGAGSNALRFTLAHIISKLTPAIIILPFVIYVLDIINFLANLLNISPENFTLKLALFHTLYNILAAIILMPFISKMVKILNCMFIDHKQHKSFLSIPLNDKINKSIHLTDASLQHPEAALKALQKECSNLYNNTITLICFGIYINSTKLLKAKNVEILTEEPVIEWPDWDISKLYKKHIKPIYSDMVNYISHIESQLDKTQSNDLFAIKMASRNFLEAVKDLKFLNRNMGQYIHSKNNNIVDQYNKLRWRIAITIKEIQSFSDNDDLDDIISIADRLKLRLHQHDLLISGELNKLLQNKAIEPFVASSLINDNGYVHNICNSLIDGASIILLGSKVDIISLDKMLSSPLSKRVNYHSTCN